MSGRALPRPGLGPLRPAQIRTSLAAIVSSAPARPGTARPGPRPASGYWVPSGRHRAAPAAACLPTLLRRGRGFAGLCPNCILLSCPLIRGGAAGLGCMRGRAAASWPRLGRTPPPARWPDGKSIFIQLMEISSGAFAAFAAPEFFSLRRSCSLLLRPPCPAPSFLRHPPRRASVRS